MTILYGDSAIFPYLYPAEMHRRIIESREVISKARQCLEGASQRDILGDRSA
jgi:hypothetical protein